MGSFGPQHPLVGRSQLEHRLVGVPAERKRGAGGHRRREGTERGAWASDAGLSPQLPDLAPPSAGARLSLLNLRPRLVTEPRVLLCLHGVGES